MRSVSKPPVILLFVYVFGPSIAHEPRLNVYVLKRTKLPKSNQASRKRDTRNNMYLKAPLTDDFGQYSFYKAEKAM